MSEHWFWGRGGAPVSSLGQPGPGDFPLGSPQSRAAARARLDRDFELPELLVFWSGTKRFLWAPPNHSLQKRSLPGPDGKALVLLDNDDPIPEWLANLSPRTKITNVGWATFPPPGKLVPGATLAELSGDGGDEVIDVAPSDNDDEHDT